MQVQVAIDMIQGQACGTKPVELSVDFGAQLRAQVALEKIAHPCPRRIGRKFLSGIDQVGNPVLWQRGMPADEGEVKPDTQGRTLPSQDHGFIASRLIDHETGSGENAVAVRAQNRGIDAFGTAKIISVDD